MIKTLLMAFACLTTVIITAQDEGTLRFQKGDFTVSGALSFGTSTSGTSGDNQIQDDVSRLDYAFEPAISLFLTDHFAIGSRLVVGRSVNERNDSFKDAIDLFRYGFFGSYYFTPEKRFSFLSTFGADFIDDKGVFERINQDTFDEIRTSRTTGVDIGLSAGINYFLTAHFALNARLGVVSYTTNKEEGDEGFTVSQKTFRLNTQLRNISFGMLYRI